jgi:hypothetical protein
VRELRAVWILVAAAWVAVVVTYARLPAVELYNVSRSGLGGGLSRVLVEANFPDALIALAVLGVIAPLLAPRLRPIALVAALLAVVVAVPGVVDQNDLDARWINVVPALGTLLAAALTPFARIPAARNRRGDALRVAVVASLVLLASPWIAAELGFYLDGVPLLGRLFQTERLVTFHNAPHHAVHHGVHHGLQGLLLVTTALLLSRLPNRISLFLALMFAYGLGNIANDAWLEQVAERRWTSWTIPSGLQPAATWTWLAVLVATPVVWLLWFRPQPSRTTPAPASAAIASPE